MPRSPEPEPARSEPISTDSECVEEQFHDLLVYVDVCQILESHEEFSHISIEIRDGTPEDTIHPRRRSTPSVIEMRFKTDPHQKNNGEDDYVVVDGHAPGRDLIEMQAGAENRFSPQPVFRSDSQASSVMPIGCIGGWFDVIEDIVGCVCCLY